MNQKSSIMILGSGLMVLTLATLTALFLFSPASKSARVRSSEKSSYPDISSLTQEGPPGEENPQTSTPTGNAPVPSTSALVPSRNYRFGTGTSSINPSDPGVAVTRPETSTRGSLSPLTTPQESAGSQIWSQSQGTPANRPTAPANQVTTSSSTKPSSTAQTQKPATAAPTKKPASSPTKPTQSAKPAPKKIPTTTYWIQLASYSSLSRAKGTQEDLKKIGLSTNIEVSDIGGGRLVYRLKTGAWTSEKDAQNFLSQFKTSNPRFADAFVVNNRGKR
ncbi:MAG: SPOR domain-containing protein [Spirochaetia bacterium]